MSRSARDYAEDWVRMGTRMQKQMEYKKAESSFRKAVHADPTFSDAWKMYGEVLLELKNYDEAENAFSKAIELDARYESEGLARKAEITKIKNKALALDTLRIGIRFLGKSQIHNAINQFEKGTELDCELGLAWKLLGDALFLGGSLRTAREAHQKARVLDPKLMGEILDVLEKEDHRGFFEHDYTEILILLVSEAASQLVKDRHTIKIHSDKILKKVEMLEKKLEDNLANIDNWKELAILLDLLDRHAEAAEAFSKALEIDLTDIKTQTHLVVSLHKQAKSILLSSKTEMEIVPLTGNIVTTENSIILALLLRGLFQILNDKPPDYYI